MDIRINSRIIIPANELEWRFSRSSGSGGQNVNKTESRVELIFDISNSKVFSPYQKFQIISQLKTKIINGSICIATQDKRTQYENRKLAISRLTSLVRDQLKPQIKARRETKPTRASQKRRVDLKKKRGELKKNRNYKTEDNY